MQETDTTKLINNIQAIVKEHDAKINDIQQMLYDSKISELSNKMDDIQKMLQNYIIEPVASNTDKSPGDVSAIEQKLTVIQETLSTLVTTSIDNNTNTDLLATMIGNPSNSSINTGNTVNTKPKPRSTAKKPAATTPKINMQQQKEFIKSCILRHVTDCEVIISDDKKTSGKFINKKDDVINCIAGEFPLSAELLNEVYDKMRQNRTGCNTFGEWCTKYIEKLWNCMKATDKDSIKQKVLESQ